MYGEVPPLTHAKLRLPFEPLAQLTLLSTVIEPPGITYEILTEPLPVFTVAVDVIEPFTYEPPPPPAVPSVPPPL